MRNLPEIVVEFSGNEKILNPHQRQLFEDTKRMKDKMALIEKDSKDEDCR